MLTKGAVADIYILQPLAELGCQESYKLRYLASRMIRVNNWYKGSF